MNIFSALRVYAGKWAESDKRDFTQEEISSVDKAEVVASNFGLSVCFYMKAGGQTYIPLDQNSTLVEHDIVDLKASQLITLSRQGDGDIFRVRA